MSQQKLWTKKEVAEYKNDKGKTLFIIHNDVYDVQAFLDEHPGGHEVLVEQKGQDASENFDDIGHSSDAKELMKKYKLGELVESERKNVHQSSGKSFAAHQKELNSEKSNWFLPVVLGIIATILYYYIFDGPAPVKEA